MKFHSVVENQVIRQSRDGEVEEEDSDIGNGVKRDRLSDYRVSSEGRKGRKGAEVGSERGKC